MIPAWLVIAVVGAAISSAFSLLSSRDIKWFRQLRRPNWLTFEPAIPVVSKHGTPPALCWPIF